MSNDHERRQKRREGRWLDDYSTNELIQKLNETEDAIRKLQCHAARFRGVINLRQGQANKANGLVGANASDDDPEMLFLEDDDNVPDNAPKEDIAKETGLSGTPRQPLSVPIRGSSLNPFGFSPSTGSPLRRDAQRLRNEKLNELIKGQLPEDLQLWLEDTRWFDAAHKVAKLQELKRKDRFKHMPRIIVGNAVKPDGNTRCVDITGPSLNGQTPKTPTKQQQVHMLSRATEPSARSAHPTSMSRDPRLNRIHSARDPLRSDGRSRASDRRSRSSSPSYGRDIRHRPSTDISTIVQDPRRGNVNRRDLERARAPRSPSPLAPPNPRINSPPRTPPPRVGGIVVGSSGGWGTEGGWDGGAGWMSQFKPLPK